MSRQRFYHHVACADCEKCVHAEDASCCYQCGRAYCDARCLAQNIIQYADGSFCKLCDPHAHAKVDREDLLAWLIATHCSGKSEVDVEAEYKTANTTAPVPCAECQGKQCELAGQRVWQHTAEGVEYYEDLPMMGHCCTCSIDMEHASERCAACYVVGTEASCSSTSEEVEEAECAAPECSRCLRCSGNLPGSLCEACLGAHSACECSPPSSPSSGISPRASSPAVTEDGEEEEEDEPCAKRARESEPSLAPEPATGLGLEEEEEEAQL